jgi:hypothetical protein
MFKKGGRLKKKQEIDYDWPNNGNVNAIQIGLISYTTFDVITFSQLSSISLQNKDIPMKSFRLLLENTFCLFIQKHFPLISLHSV